MELVGRESCVDKNVTILFRQRSSLRSPTKSAKAFTALDFHDSKTKQGLIQAVPLTTPHTEPRCSSSSRDSSSALPSSPWLAVTHRRRRITHNAKLNHATMYVYHARLTVDVIGSFAANGSRFVSRDNAIHRATVRQSIHIVMARVFMRAPEHKGLTAVQD